MSAPDAVDSEEVPLRADTEADTEADSEADKKVSWAELFFDLVFVVAITRVSELLEHDHAWGGLLDALIVFVPIYWLWVGTAILTNLSDTSRVVLHLRIFAIALAGIFMAIAVPDAFHGTGLLFAFAYWLGRIVMGADSMARAVRARQVPLTPYSVSIVLTGPLLVVGGATHGDARTLLWGIAAAIDLSAPTVLARWLRSIHYDAGHLAERFGLFLLIALGESVVVTATSTDHLTTTQGVAVGAAFALSCGLWWVYFHFAADAMRHALATAKVQLDITRLVLSYGHLAFIGAVILIAVGLHEAIHDPSHHLSGPIAGLLFGGCALYLAAFGFTRWAMFRLVSWTRLGAAAVVLVLLPVAPQVPALASLIALAGVLIALNAYELAKVEQLGWRRRRGSTVR